MNKTAAALVQVPALLKEAQAHMDLMSNKLAELHSAHSTALHEIQAMKVAQRMVERNLDPSTGWEQKVASLRGMSSEKLATMEQAIELAQGGLNLPRPDSTDRVVGGGLSIDDFILSQSALG